jgi:5-methylcytosine-specific restriction protein A
MFGRPTARRDTLGLTEWHVPSKDEFRTELRSQLREAELRGGAEIAVNSGELHRKLGGYPGASHQMPSCCDAMYDEQRPGDAILSAPTKGKGASLTIQYRLPR